jgi:uncharacterized membrane protein
MMEAMVPLIVMLIAWAGFRVLGLVGLIPDADSWAGALRLGLACMFLFTALSHFLPRTRRDLVRMVPPRLPKPELLVTVTGLLEFAGAVGLLVPALARQAAWCLIALLVAMFPANMHAAKANLMIAGRRATPMSVRLPLQLFWIATLWWVAKSV